MNTELMETTKVRNFGMQETLFEVLPLSPLRLAVGNEVHNYRRSRNGQPFKVMLRDLRTGKIAATVYGGMGMAKYIADCVNAKGGAE